MCPSICIAVKHIMLWEMPSENLCLKNQSDSTSDLRQAVAWVEMKVDLFRAFSFTNHYVLVEVWLVMDQ